MSLLLHISASPRGERSYSLRTATAFTDAYAKAHPDDTIRVLDLATATLPAFDAMAVSGKYRILHNESHTKEEATAWAAVESVVEDFKSADKLVVSSPMWNFGIPYRLKHYFDLVVQPGYTFSFSPETGYTGLMTDRPALLVLSRGGEYAAGTESEGYNQQTPYLKLILGFMGFRSIETIVIEPTLMAGPDAARQKLDEAMALAGSLAMTF